MSGGDRDSERKTDGGRARAVSGRGLAAALNRRPIAILIFAIALFRAGAMWHSLAVNFNPQDFSIYYCSALTLRQGGNPYHTDMRALARSLGLEQGYVDQTNDPPTFLLGLEPLGLLSPHHAYWAWQVLNAAAFAAALYLLLWPGYSGLSGSMALALAGFAILFPPVGNNFAIAQSKMLALLPLAAMLRLMERRRDGLAGIMLALAGLIRVFPLLLGGYLLLTRRWRVLGYTVGATLVGAILTLVLMGVDNSLGFFSVVGSLGTERWLSETSNISLAAFISRILWTLSGGAHGSLLELARRTSIVGADLLVLYLVVRATGFSGGEDRDGRAFSLWVVAAVMLSPTAWFHYMLLLLIPFAQAASAANRGAVSARAIWMMVAAYLAIGLTGNALLFASGNEPLFERVRELESICLLIAFVAAYWFAADAAERTSGVAFQATAAD